MSLGFSSGPQCLTECARKFPSSLSTNLSGSASAPASSSRCDLKDRPSVREEKRSGSVADRALARAFSSWKERLIEEGTFEERSIGNG